MPVGATLKVGLTQKVLFLVSGIVMLCAAVIDGSKYYTGLEIIIVTSCVLAFLSIPRVMKLIIPIILCLIILFWLFNQNEITNFQQLFGALGLVIVALGFATSFQLYYLFGSLIVMIFSIAKYLDTQNSLALVFALLNFIAIFASYYGWIKSKRNQNNIANT
jgi:hypothetical protein